jgi:hypothetical protein
MVASILTVAHSLGVSGARAAGHARVKRRPAPGRDRADHRGGAGQPAPIPDCAGDRVGSRGGDPGRQRRLLDRAQGRSLALAPAGSVRASPRSCTRGRRAFIRPTRLEGGVPGTLDSRPAHLGLGSRHDPEHTSNTSSERSAASAGRARNRPNSPDPSQAGVPLQPCAKAIASVMLTFRARRARGPGLAESRGGAKRGSAVSDRFSNAK